LPSTSTCTARADVLGDDPAGLDVDRIGHEVALQRQPDAARHRGARLVLGLGGGGTQVRGHHDVGQTEQRAVGAGLLGVDVDAGGAHLTGLEGGGQRRLVDQAAASGVDDDHAALGGGELLGTDEAQRLGRLGQVDADEVRLAQQLVQGHQPDAELGGPPGLDVGVVGDEGDAEGCQPLGHQDADAPQADDADGLLGDLDAGELRPGPLPRAQRGVRGRDVPGGGQQQGDGVLGRADDVRGGRVDHEHPARGSGGDVDVVQADAGPRDHLQPRCRGEGLGVDLGGRPDEDGGGVGEGRQQGCPVGAVDVPDLDVGPQHLQDTGSELLGDQDDGCGPRHSGSHGATA
jgi:hypothetical protein